MADRTLNLTVTAAADKAAFASSRREIRQTTREIDRMSDSTSKLDRQFKTIERAQQQGVIGRGRAGQLRRQVRMQNLASMLPGQTGRFATGLMGGGMGAMAAGIGIFAAAAGAFALAVRQFASITQTRRDAMRDLGIDPDTDFGRRISTGRESIASIARERLSAEDAANVANALTRQAVDLGMDPQRLAAMRARQLRNLSPRFRGRGAEDMGLPAEFGALAGMDWGVPVAGTGELPGGRLFEGLSREQMERVRRFGLEVLDREEDP